MNREQRFQIRASQGEEFVLAGRALSYSEVSSNELAPGVRERVMPGCFKASLASGSDVKALLNHDVSSLPLGRLQNGTLKLTDSDTGLDMRVQLDKNNSQHRDVYASVKRGDISEMSFAFTVDDEDLEDGEYEGQRCKVRNIRKAALHDVSVVTSPFYGAGATSVSARTAGGDTGAFDTEMRKRAMKVRDEIFASAPAFRAVFKPGQEWPDIVPDYSSIFTDEDRDALNRRLAELYGQKIAIDFRAYKSDLETALRMASAAGNSGLECAVRRELEAFNWVN